MNSKKTRKQQRDNSPGSTAGEREASAIAQDAGTDEAGQTPAAEDGHNS